MKISIDGNEYNADKGMSVLDVALKNEIWIPSFCHNKFLSSYGVCRLCLVEMIVRDWTKVTASCTLGVKDGMQIVTKSKRIDRLRRLNMELILANCPNSDPVKKMAEKLGVQEGRLSSNKDNDCILCGMCVRACSEISGTQAISFAHRGTERCVSTAFGKISSDCVLCGSCVSVCPTGSRLLDLAKISGEKPQKLLSKFEAELSDVRAIERPFPQAVPNVPVINQKACLKLNRDSCGICEKVCEPGAIKYDDSDREAVIDVGAVIVSSGFEEFLSELKYDYGYSRFEDVLSSIQFERILSASGPFAGHVQRPSDGKKPKKIAFLQCVGSRDISCRNNYCSSVCCMYAIKEAVIAKEHIKDLDVTVFFMDMRAFGKDFDKYYERANTEYGVNFVRARVSNIDKKVDGSLTVKYSTQRKTITTDDFDMVVLSAGLEPNADTRALAKKLGIKLEPNGFIWNEPLNPLRTSRPGVFVGGVASGPKDIPETVVQASATACEASQLLSEARNTLTKKQVFPSEIDTSNQIPRIGAFICHCGINIGGVVDVPSVVEFTKSLKHVVYVEDNLYTCSQDSQEHIKAIIEEYKLNRIFVASCSPRTHEQLFQQTLKEAGLNPYLFEMANIRDQCSWVHMKEPELATWKAKSLVAMGIAKTMVIEPLQAESLDVTQSALVIGGGLAGMTAALSLAEQEFKVSLIERKKQLGGNLNNLHYIFDEHNVQTYLDRLEEKLRNHKLIDIYTNANINNIDGFIGNFESTVDYGNKEVKIPHGATIVATGGTESKPVEYLYGKDDRVLTQLELEERLSKSAKTKIKNLDTVVMIQCVGSREEGHMYCSRVCCTTAVKNALEIKKLSPDTKVYVLYRDMRTYGFSEKYFQTARDKGIIFSRYEREEKPVLNNGKDLSITIHEPILDCDLIIHPDIVVLSSRIDADQHNRDLAKMLKVPMNEDGFFLEAHVKLRPVEFATEGVFVAGLAHSPKSIPETIAQAKAAAAKACSIISKNKYQGEAKIARVDTTRCSACGACTEVCAYKAIELVVDERTKEEISHVNPALCKGCGTCSAICRSGSINIGTITDDQIIRMIKAK
ncbi:MAG TPA: FAD-dependent oxidoreductase [Victivallales bacterium]|nr:FAD-dependent oxidoreductase [Victivallales bacterium]